MRAFLLVSARIRVTICWRIGPQAIARCNEEHILVIGVGVGPGCDAVKRHYPYHITVPDPDGLGEELSELLLDVYDKWTSGELEI